MPSMAAYEASWSAPPTREVSVLTSKVETWPAAPYRAASFTKVEVFPIPGGPVRARVAAGPFAVWNAPPGSGPRSPPEPLRKPLLLNEVGGRLPQ